MNRSRKRVTRSRQFSSRSEMDSFRSSKTSLPKGLPSEASRRPQGRGASPLGDRSARPLANAAEWFGPQIRGRRKIARPFEAGREMEALFQSKRARGKWAFDLPKHSGALRRLLKQEADRTNVSLLRIENGGDHVLLRLKARDRRDLSRFLRGVGGKIPRLVAGAEKSRPISRVRTPMPTQARRFWDGLVATRIVEKAL